MRRSISLDSLVPLIFALGGCSTDHTEQPAGADASANGGAESPNGTGGRLASGGMSGNGKGGTSGAAGAAAGGSTATGGAGGSKASGGAGGSKASGGTGGSTAAGGTGGGRPLSFECSAPTPTVAAPPATWVNATGNLAGMTSECGNLGLVSANPCSDMVIAGVAKAGLWGTEDGGKTWGKLGSGQGSAEITNRISAIVYDPEHEGTFWESGIYNGGGVYKTTDNGKTFQQLGDAHHNDSVSVDFTDPDRKTLLAGAHEMNSTA